MKIRKSLVTLTGAIFVLTGCNINKESGRSQFGDFSYNGIFLTEYATKQIKVDEAKTLIDSESKTAKLSSKSSAKDSLEDESITNILSKYSAMVATTSYYVSDLEKEQVRSDSYQGTDFLALLESNHYEPFGQMSVKYIYVNDGLLDSMEEANTEFVNNKENLVSPFNAPYTYHTNESNELIIQTHSFAELPASVNGGIGSTFRQDCEIIFDSEGKITFWQSSLGLYTSTPTGTIKQGYIFSVSFDWNLK